jgi:hypothetical protein
VKLTKACAEAIEKAEREGRVDYGLVPATARNFAYVWPIRMWLACRVVSEANRRDHWAVRGKRFRKQAETLLAVWLAGGLPLRLDLTGRFVVTWTHVGKKMDTDNLAGAFKGLRDYLAKLLGVDDGDERYRWEYQQRLETVPARCGVELSIVPEKTLR